VGRGLPVRRHRYRAGVKILHVVDKFTRKSHADLVEHSIDADATVACLDKMIPQCSRHPGVCQLRRRARADRQRPARDWCRFAECGTSYIEPAHPGRTPVESYGSRNRDELLAIEPFDTLLDAQVLIGDWRSARTRRVRGPVEAGGPTHPSSHRGLAHQRVGEYAFVVDTTVTVHALRGRGSSRKSTARYASNCGTGLANPAWPSSSLRRSTNTLFALAH
jgi:hypothetical protein